MLCDRLKQARSNQRQPFKTIDWSIAQNCEAIISNQTKLRYFVGWILRWIIIIIHEFHRDCKSWNKTSGPLCVTYYTTAITMLLWPIVCIAVWSAEQFRFQCTLECPERCQRRDRRRQRVPNLCRGNGECTIADGPVQRPWNMQRRWRCRSQTHTWLDVGDPL